MTLSARGARGQWAILTAAIGKAECQTAKQSKMQRFGIVLRFVQLRSCRRLCSTNASQQETHSSSQESSSQESEHEEDLIKHRILETALTYVPQLGWSNKALAAGAEAQGLPGTAHGLFPNGPADLISYFYLSCNDRLTRHMSDQKAKLEEQEQKLRVTPFIRDAVETRLRMNIPHIDTWASAMAIMASPQNAPRAWRNLNSLVDDIWFHAGDTSVDMSWYTKRMSLAAVYKASEIHMLQDQSADFVDTWEFLDRRIESIIALGKTLSQAKGGVEKFGELLQHSFILGKNILGVNQRHR